MTVKQIIELALKYPYDFSEEEHRALNGKLHKPTDWGEFAARAVIADLTDRRGIKQELDAIDINVRKEIIQELGKIIKEAHRIF